ncbi:MAG: hypothetical protein AB7E32_02255 [Desulfovibrio sp.]
MRSLGLNYEDCRTRLRSQREWLGSPEAREAFGLLVNELCALGPKPRIAVYGSSWSGYMAVRLLEELGAERPVLIFESREPLPQLADIPHQTLEPADARAQADLVLLATAPRHYAHTEALVRAKVAPRALWTMYAPDPETAPLAKPDTFLRVSSRFGTTAKPQILPLNRRQMALILVDIWDTGQERCPYCATLPRLLNLARRHDLVVIHAPTYALDSNGGFLSKPLAAPDSNGTGWPPLDFICKQGPFAWRDRYHDELHFGGRTPRRIHACAAPVDRPREHVESSLDGVRALLEKERILYLLYAGGGTLRCLAFKPAGYVNTARSGYQPILVREATAHDPQVLDGADVDMRSAGIVCFENLCGFSTGLDDLEHALGTGTPGPADKG